MKKPKPRFWWIAVDLDDNETVLAVAESIYELADIMGTSIAVISRKSKRKKPWGYKVEKIPYTDDEEEGD